MIRSVKPDKPEIRSLIVLYDPISSAPSSREIIDKVNKRKKGSNAVSDALGNPTHATHLIGSRIPPERMQFLTEKAPYSPDSLLQRYVILTYPSGVPLAAVMKRIRQDKRILSVEKNINFELASTAPNDEYFTAIPQIVDTIQVKDPYNLNNGAPVLTETNYQWGLHTLKFPEAWDFERGHAYLGVIDSGIDTDHPDLLDNFRPHLSRLFKLNLTNGQLETSLNVEDSTLAGTARGHGTHVAGILAATTDNNQGVAGACWDCNLMISKSDLKQSSLVANIDHLVNFGAQAINMSFTSPRHTDPSVIDSKDSEFCSMEEHTDGIVLGSWGSVCTALRKAADHDVVLVAAAGNGFKPSGAGSPYDFHVGFPALHPNVISVGAIRSDLSRWVHFSDNTVSTYISNGSAHGPFLNNIDLMAPGQHVMSTWPLNPFIEHYIKVFSCGSNYGPGPVDDGYGLCTGTSMATPHITALAGLIRSANPLLSSDAVKTIMTNNANRANERDEEYGYGYPDAEKSVKESLGFVSNAPYYGQLNNRLTPLFSMYLNSTTDSFYTTVPQMATSILKNLGCNVSYPRGSSVPGYVAFPDTATICNGHHPKAEAYLFTTHNKPAGQTSDLKPLYRLFSNNQASPDHAYVLESEQSSSTFNTYVLEGITGYLYDKNQNQPANTVGLWRAYHSDTKDHTLYTGDNNTAPPSEYSNKVLLGYVYENNDSDNDGLVDGFEYLIGTSVNSNDTDGDGFKDGDEIGQYPYTDPRNDSDHPKVHVVSTNGVGRLWKTVGIPGGFKGSVVIAGVPTTHENQPGVVRMKHVDGNNFQMRFQEWDYLNPGHHLGETVSTMVIKKGRYNMPDGTIWEAGIISRVHFVGSDFEPYGLLWNTTSFSEAFPGTPKLFLTAQTANGTQAVTVRARQVTMRGFQSALFEQECNMKHPAPSPNPNPYCASGKHILEDIGYLAIYKPTPESTLGQVPLYSTGSNTNYDLLSRQVGHQYVNVLGTNFRVEEEQSFDLEVNHLLEDLSILRINNAWFSQDMSSLGGNTIAVRRTP